jgi:hypothetical protein
MIDVRALAFLVSLRIRILKAFMDSPSFLPSSTFLSSIFLRFFWQNIHIVMNTIMLINKTYFF